MNFHLRMIGFVLFMPMILTELHRLKVYLFHYLNQEKSKFEFEFVKLPNNNFLSELQNIVFKYPASFYLVKGNNFNVLLTCDSLGFKSNFYQSIHFRLEC